MIFPEPNPKDLEQYWKQCTGAADDAAQEEVARINQLDRLQELLNLNAKIAAFETQLTGIRFEINLHKAPIARREAEIMTEVANATTEAPGAKGALKEVKLFSNAEARQAEVERRLQGDAEAFEHAKEVGILTALAERVSTELAILTRTYGTLALFVRHDIAMTYRGVMLGKGEDPIPTPPSPDEVDYLGEPDLDEGAPTLEELEAEEIEERPLDDHAADNQTLSLAGHHEAPE